MNRHECTHGRFAAAFGVDDATGPFCQVWKAPMARQDAALLVLDNEGVHERSKALESAASPFKGMAEMVHRHLETVRFRYKQAIVAGHPLPNLDHATVTRILVLFGFPGEIGREVQEAMH